MLQGTKRRFGFCAVAFKRRNNSSSKNIINNFIHPQLLSIDKYFIWGLESQWAVISSVRLPCLAGKSFPHSIRKWDELGKTRSFIYSVLNKTNFTCNMFHYFLPILTAKRDCLGAGNSVAENIEFFFFFSLRLKTVTTSRLLKLSRSVIKWNK